MVTSKHNFPKHRYKYGKQKKAIGLTTFKRMLDKVDKIDLGKYDPLTVKSFLVILFWTGLRKTEVIGAKAHRYILPACRDHPEPIVKYSEAIPGILKDDMQIVGEDLVIEAVARKHGKRTAPLELWLKLPFMNLLIKQLKARIEKGGDPRVWPISEWNSWKIMKQIDKRKYLHYFRFNRITDFCSDPTMSIADVCSWTGLMPQTIDAYMERSGRFIKRAAQGLRRRYGVEATEQPLK